MSIAKGVIDVRILSDGTVRSETGDMGGPSHKAADLFLIECARLLGGLTHIEPAKHAHSHTHAHGHDHHHDHA